jgi:hypothetical protein
MPFERLGAHEAELEDAFVRDPFAARLSGERGFAPKDPISRITSSHLPGRVRRTAVSMRVPIQRIEMRIAPNRQLCERMRRI